MRRAYKKDSISASPARLQNERGFTLIEVSISLVVMMVVGLGTASLFFYSITNNTSAADRELSMAVAQTRMEALRNVAFTDASLAAGTTTTGTTGGEADPTIGTSPNIRSYRVTTTIEDQNVTNLDGTSKLATKLITIQVTPLASGPAWQQSNTVFGSVRLVGVRSSVVAGDYKE